MTWETTAAVDPSSDATPSASSSSSAPQVTASASVLRPQPAKASWFRRAWFGLADQARMFFFAGDRVDQPEDAMVEVIRRSPSSGSSLLQMVALFSIAGNIFSTAVCGGFLAYHWSECGLCGRPLRWWLLLQASFQMSQLPVRVVLVVSLRRAEASGSSVENAIASLTSSPAWMLSKKIALFQYGWFVLGLVWWMYTDSCPNCPGIAKLMASVMMLSGLRAAAAIVIFKAFFPADQHGNAAEVAAPVVGATTRQIRANPIVWYEPASSDDETSACSCSICLSDFAVGASMRRLPCAHQFHRSCIDKWLARNKRCPLCMHAIDEVCSWAPPVKLRSGREERQSCRPRRHNH